MAEQIESAALPSRRKFLKKSALGAAAAYGLSLARGAHAAGSQQINGVATTKITGNSSANDIATLAGVRLTDENVSTVPTTIWTASDGSSHLVQIEIFPTANTSVRLTMSEWGKQVTATRPV